ncbi:hypothetical protein CAPTEDRAFT_196970 [Capitella teleta]|uniref:VWFD domain-containing protein n=1 Tax=Capitella teleta TaxID=283909 RepID=R7TIR1_CAPTE|nr:hypothetical protein CAPTEDRAFT_196970 [Capitella teleta]|eukprot:ELT90980.1 hypothetical protein CAPTEDRAFT_196970 [Capitella teleta]
MGQRTRLNRQAVDKKSTYEVNGTEKFGLVGWGYKPPNGWTSPNPTLQTSEPVCGEGNSPVCITCHGAKDDKDCFFGKATTWEQCPDETYTCVRSAYLNEHGQLRISRKCGKLAKCPTFKAECQPEQEPSKSCSKCNFENPSTYSNCNFARIVDTNICRLVGDPHVKQLNALTNEPLLNLNGRCKYNVVTTYCEPGQGLGWFELHASFMSNNEGKSAFAQKLSITYHDDMYMLESNVIDLFGSGPITIPFEKSGMRIQMRGDYYFFLMKERVTVVWDGHHMVNVRVPKTIQVCGLCGQHTKDFQGADLRVGPSYEAGYCKNMNVTSDTTPFNGMARSMKEYMNSWYIGQNGQPACAKECEF